MQDPSRRPRFRVGIDKAIPNSVGGKCSVISPAVPGADQAAPSPLESVEESAMSFSSPPGCEGAMRGGIEEGIDKAMPSNSKHGFMASMRVQHLEVPPSHERKSRITRPRVLISSPIKSLRPAVPQRRFASLTLPLSGRPKFPRSAAALQNTASPTLRLLEKAGSGADLHTLWPQALASAGSILRLCVRGELGRLALRFHGRRNGCNMCYRYNTFCTVGWADLFTEHRGATAASAPTSPARIGPVC